MPWVAIPFKEDLLRRQLGTRADIRGLPSLINFNEDGSLLTKNGKKIT